MSSSAVPASDVRIALGEPQTIEKVVSHEEAAHEKRNWVRLTFECNNRCVFCLDSDTHDGRMRDRDEVKQQILEGRKAGATRLILSGGEPTIHPSYVDFIKLGKLAGYTKIQTVTNGRLFQYQDFLDRCIAAGLDEITFSLHGPNARIHDALVGVKGAFEQESAGLRRAIATRDRTGRPIVNVDIVINRANVKHLKEMLDLFISWGVHEFDLLQVVPFGRAFTEGRTTLFYDLEEMQPYLREAFEYTKRPGMHIWLNRFPPPHLEGFEHLIQDPYKLNDEVRGRKEEFARLLATGEDLDCREKEGRCRYCYLEQLCNHLYDERDRLAADAVSRVRIDTEAERNRPVVFGGDPASAKRAIHFGGPAEGEAESEKPQKRALPIVGALAAKTHAVKPRTLDERIGAASITCGWIVAPDLARAREAIAAHRALTDVELELGSIDGLLAALDGDHLDGRRVIAVHVKDVADAETLLASPHGFDVVVALTTRTQPWLLAMASPPARLVLRQPTHERLTESASEDVDLPAFFAAFRHDVPVIDVPACVIGRAPRAQPATLDASMLSAEGALEIFRFTRRHIESGYMTKALRCRTCVHDATCRGMHVNYVRAHGYGLMRPIVETSIAAE
ncbi:radical SAM protein [Sandaracinus amylolyticus]|uniref:radical SAM protein n=1 Tax=Sandaracinus amylolyticus TaxID=927083 RepID=UPI0009F82266|nr:radical SAM protein [Sandaracinus amylolyticus]